VAGSGGVEIVGLRTPARPTLLAILPDAAGAMPLGSGLLTWNERGLFQDGRRVSGAAEPVMAVAARRGVIYVLGRDGVTIFDSRLAHIGTIAGSTGTGMAAVGNRLVLADAQGLRTYDLTSPERPGTACSFPLPGIQSFETTSVGGSQRVLAALAEGHFTIVDVAGDVALIAARYNQRPWFAGSACLRDVTVRPAGSANIDIFTPGPKATMRF
jgi:hypothetical protein